MHPTLQQLHNQISQVVLGKESQIELLLIALLSQGHVLLEDIPGIGKTTLAKTFAQSLDCDFRRVQFTPDLLPSDILGTSIFNTQDSQFHFHPGPIFTHILMADEINRASPRTQSSLLEAMAEKQVTIEGEAKALESPFLVIATQNPVEYHGTYPLPEAQLDRFAICLSLGYPDMTQELELLLSQQPKPQQLEPVLTREDIIRYQHALKEVTARQEVAQYLLNIVLATRNHPQIALGVSPRGSLALFQAAKARAFLHQRDYLLPEDVKTLASPVLTHRLQLNHQAKYSGVTKSEVLAAILEETPVPR